MRDDNSGASLQDRATHKPSPDGLGHTVSVPRAEHAGDSLTLRIERKWGIKVGPMPRKVSHHV